MISKTDERDCVYNTCRVSTDSSEVFLKTDMKISRGRSSAVMIACLYMVMCCIGMFPGLGVIYVELISSLHTQRSDAALVQSLYLGLSLGGGILFTKIITKYDTGICVMVASTIAGASVACGSLARDIGTVVALVGVVAGLSASVNLISSFSVINWVFINNRKFALSILTVGIAIGQTILPLITDVFVEMYSWRGTFLILGALLYLNCIPCGLIIHFSKRYFKAGKEENLSSKMSIKVFLSDIMVMIYLTALLMDTLLGPVESWFIVDVAVMKGIEMQSGTILLSLNGIFGLVGRLTCTVILKFYPDTRSEVHMSYGFLALAVAHLCIIRSSVYTLMFLGMVLRGLSTGIIFGLLPTLQLEICGTENFPQMAAISYMVMGVGDIIGGYIGGYSADVTGSYDLIFYIAAVGSIYCTISMVLIYVILKRRRRHIEQYQRVP